MFALLILLSLYLLYMTLTRPWPQWVFWAVCQLLVGFLNPVALILLAVSLLIHFMFFLWRVTHR